MIPLALITGVLAGIREGSAQDRSISFISVLFTSIPEIATAIFLTVIFALGLGWLPRSQRATAGNSSSSPSDPGPLRFRLRGAHDPRLGRRSGHLAICAHRHPQRGCPTSA
jgi:ABC-type dipeptide/oligopeptide/nickel transport system permease component